MASSIVVVISFFKEIEILRNSEARAHEDLDRLHKAQVMYTFAEFSILEFDPALRMECQCMAMQERKRPEEQREANTERGCGATAAAKLEWERHDDKAQCWSLMDAIKSERRLKRQRSEAGDAVTLPRIRMPRKKGTPKKRVEASQAGA
ncbi:hypothetical protein JOM56_013310 [Amanita muscaria]